MSYLFYGNTVMMMCSCIFNINYDFVVMSRVLASCKRDGQDEGLKYSDSGHQCLFSPPFDRNS